MTDHTETLYRVNDALTLLAGEFGVEVSDATLNEATHTVAQLFGIVPREPRHEDPTIAAFLVDGGYNSIEAWMLDSDYRFDKAEQAWREVHHGGVIEPEDAIAGAIEACGFTVELPDVHDDEQVIRCIFTMSDVDGIAADNDYDLVAARSVAREWGRKIADTITQIAGEQLESVILTGQP